MWRNYIALRFRKAPGAVGLTLQAAWVVSCNYRSNRTSGLNGRAGPRNHANHNRTVARIVALDVAQPALSSTKGPAVQHRAAHSIRLHEEACGSIQAPVDRYLPPQGMP